ncbi:MAG: acyltransferase family protein [Candidatus Komeilibacteria bacterium]
MIQRLTNIDIIKFLSIIIMVIDHMILTSIDQTANVAQVVFFTFVPLCQMGFLFSSGYLMAYSFNKQKFNKYIYRIALFVILFILMTVLSGEKFIASGSILLNFAISIAISLFFLYRDKVKDLFNFVIILFGLNILFQLFTMNGITVLNDIMANYPYPVNSFSLYFFMGVILFSYKNEVRTWFKGVLPTLITTILLIGYPFIYAYGIYINKYSFYQHLPLLILASAFIGLYFFYKWENVKIPNIIHKPIIKIADALLYIYVIHYIALFGFIKDYNLPWWLLIITVILIIILSIYLKKVVYYIKKLYLKV